MVLNFGGNQLFNTSLEERWKGVFEERKEEVSSAGIAVGSTQTNLNTSFEDISGATVTIRVAPDQKVLILAHGSLDGDSAQERMTIKIQRNSVDVGVVGTSYANQPTTARLTQTTTINYLDSPGEGIHTYKMQGKSSEGTGDLFDPVIIAVVVGIN